MNEEIGSQLDRWAAAGVIEADAAAAVKWVVSDPKNRNLSGRTFVLIGAGSAMGPFLVLMALSVIGGFAKEHAESPVAPPPELAPVLQIAFPPRPAPAAFDVEVGADAYTKYADALLLRLSMPSFPPWIWWGVCGFLIQ